MNTPNPTPRRVQEFWDTARSTLPHLPPSAPNAWSFGANPQQANYLLTLVLTETKTVTSSALSNYTSQKQPLPVTGQYNIICDGEGAPRAIIQTTEVTITEFTRVTAEHAYAEGEGDRTLDSWRATHRQHWEDNSPSGFTPHMKVICERFSLIYPTIHALDLPGSKPKHDAKNNRHKK